MVLAHIVEHGPAPRVEKGLLVVAEPVKKIKHRKVLGGVLGRASVITCRQIDAVVDGVFENVAVEGVAINPTLRVGGYDGDKEQKQKDDEKTARHRSSLLVA
jgi:hypothetical protein